MPHTGSQRRLVSLVLSIFVFIAVVVGVWAVRQAQDIRQQAASNFDSCYESCRKNKGHQVCTCNCGGECTRPDAEKGTGSGSSSCDSYTTPKDCSAACSPLKENGQSFQCSWSNDRCADGKQLCSGGAGGVTINAGCAVGSNAPPYNKESCTCNGTQVFFDTTGICGDSAAAGSNVTGAKSGLCALFSQGACVVITPTPSSGPTTTASVTPTADSKGVVNASKQSGARPTTQAACHGVWMNNFCYLPGDELAGGYIVVASGRYSFPYIEKKSVYESPTFNASTTQKTMGNTQTLGADCGGQGLAIEVSDQNSVTSATGGGKSEKEPAICYAYGSVVNGYVVMPPRSGSCDNSTGNYCYAHLKKIEVQYAAYNTAVTSYQKNGDLAALEKLYRDTYGVSFQIGSLFDPTAANAELLKAQALISSLTSPEVIKAQAEAQNKVITDKAKEENRPLTTAEQQLIAFNQQIIGDSSLANRPQVIDQLSNALTNNAVVNYQINNKLYRQLVEATSDAKLDQLAIENFRTIYGYDPIAKYGSVDNALRAVGLDPANIRNERRQYTADQLAQAKAQAEVQEAQQRRQDDLVDKLSKYASADPSVSLEQLKKAALEAGLVQQADLAKDQASFLALLFGRFPSLTPEQVQTQVQVAVSNQQAASRATQEKVLLEAYTKQSNNPQILADLYNFYTGKQVPKEAGTAFLQAELAKFSSSVALNLYADTQSISHLRSYLVSNNKASAAQVANATDKQLLEMIYGKQAATDLYAQIAVPNKLDAAVKNFNKDGGASLLSICRELYIADCELKQGNSTQLVSNILNKAFEGTAAQGMVPQMALNYAEQISGAQREQANLDNLAATSYAMAAAMQGTGRGARKSGGSAAAAQEQVSQLQLSAANNLATAKALVNDSLTYATANRNAISDFTWGKAYGNALMHDSISSGQYNQQTMGLTDSEAFVLNLNKVYSQAFGVDVAQNIATNYATAKYYNYTGPADTSVANVALKGAGQSGLDILDYQYQPAVSGYYTNKAWREVGDDAKSNFVYLGNYVSAGWQNTVAWAGGAPAEQKLDAHEYAMQQTEAVRQDLANQRAAALHQNFYQDSTVSQADFVQFTADREVMRSRSEYNWEVVEKVVAPTATAVVVPVLVASGVGAPLVFGAASSGFSLYQGAGMKAQALEIQRIDIDTRLEATVLEYINAGASAEEIAQVREQMKNEVRMLERQANIMLASSAVAGLTSTGGVLTQAGQAVSRANALLRAGQAVTNVGRVGGIGLSGYNAGLYGSLALQSEQERGANIALALMSATGVFSNVVSMTGGNAITNRADLVGDAFSLIGGSAIDAQQVYQACGNPNYPKTDDNACAKAWIGLALSVGMDATQLQNSTRTVTADKNAVRVQDLSKQMSAVEAQILYYKGKGANKFAASIQDLENQRNNLSVKLTDLGQSVPPLAYSKPIQEDTVYAGRVKLATTAMAELAAKLRSEGGDEALAKNLDNRVQAVEKATAEFARTQAEIDRLDQQLVKRGVVMSETELEQVKTQRSALVDELQKVAADRNLSGIKVLADVHSDVIKNSVEANPVQATERLRNINQANAELVKDLLPNANRIEELAAQTQRSPVSEIDSVTERLTNLALLQQNTQRLAEVKQELAALRQSGAPTQAEANRLNQLEQEVQRLTQVTNTDLSPWQRLRNFFSTDRAARADYVKGMELTKTWAAAVERLNSNEQEIADLTANSNRSGAEEQRLTDLQARREVLQTEVAQRNRELINQQAQVAQTITAPQKSWWTQRVVEPLAGVGAALSRSLQGAPEEQARRQLVKAKDDVGKLMSDRQQLAEITKKLQASPQPIGDELSKLNREQQNLQRSVRQLESKLTTAVMSDQQTRQLKQAQADGKLLEEIAAVRQTELDKLTADESSLDQAQRQLATELLAARKQIFAGAEELDTHRATYRDKLTALQDGMLGRNPQVADYQKLAEVQATLKRISLLDTVTDANSLSRAISQREISIDLGNPKLSAQLETMIREAELRTSSEESIAFFNTTDRQVDTFLKIISGERVAVELTTAGGKTFVGALVSRASTDLLGYDKGIYIAKPGQEAEVRKTLAKTYGVAESEIAILDYKRIAEPGYVDSLLRSKHVVTNPTDLQFLRNSANKVQDNPEFVDANRAYEALTNKVAIYMDELQINIDPTRQAIVTVGNSTEVIPASHIDNGRLVGDVFAETILQSGGWGKGEHDFLVVTTQNGAEIAKLSSAAQDTVFAELANRSGMTMADYNKIKAAAFELDAAWTRGQADFEQAVSRLMGADFESNKALLVLDQIDMVNVFAQGLKMRAGTDYQRMVDSALADRGGRFERAVTVPAAGGAANPGQSYNARLQVAMEYIGAKHSGQNPDFSELTSSPNSAYRANIADYLGDLRSSKIGAVTGAMADGFGVVETALGMTTYRSTEAVEKILSVTDSATGNRINVDKSYQINRDDDVRALAMLKRAGTLRTSAGVATNGNMKIVMGFDGAKNPLDFAAQLSRTGAFEPDTTFFIQRADGSYEKRTVLADGSLSDGQPITPRQISDAYKSGLKNGITVIGRVGATGDNIPTNKSVLGVTVTSMDAPEGLIAQSGARIDRTADVADQFALIVNRQTQPMASNRRTLTANKMTQTDFAAFRKNVAQVQLAVEKAKNTQGLNQGVVSASTRVLSDIVRNSTDMELRTWASAKLLEFYSETQGRDLDLVGGDQRSLTARQQQLAAQAAKWQRLLDDPANQPMLDKVRASNRSAYELMRSNAQVEFGKLDYAQGNRDQIASRESVITANGLDAYLQQHNRFVTADSESEFIASSGRPPQAEQVASTTNGRSGPDDGSGESLVVDGSPAVTPPTASIPLSYAQRQAALRQLRPDYRPPNPVARFVSGLLFGSVDEERLLREQQVLVAAKQAALLADFEQQLAEELAAIDAQLETLPAAQVDAARAELEQLPRQRFTASTNAVALAAQAQQLVIEEQAANYTRGGLFGSSLQRAWQGVVASLDITRYTPPAINPLAPVQLGATTDQSGEAVVIATANQQSQADFWQEVRGVAAGLWPAQQNSSTEIFDEAAYVAVHQDEIDELAVQLQFADTKQVEAEILSSKQAHEAAVKQLSAEAASLLANGNKSTDDVVQRIAAISQQIADLTAAFEEDLAALQMELDQIENDIDQYRDVARTNVVAIGLSEHAAAMQAGKTTATWRERLGGLLADTGQWVTDAGRSLVVRSQRTIAVWRGVVQNWNASAYLADRSTPFDVNQEVLLVRQMKPNSIERLIARELLRRRSAAQLRGAAALRKEFNQALLAGQLTELTAAKQMFDKYQRQYAFPDSYFEKYQQDYMRYYAYLDQIAALKAQYDVDENTRLAFVRDKFGGQQPSEPFELIFERNYVAVVFSVEDYEKIIGDDSGGLARVNQITLSTEGGLIFSTDGFMVIRVDNYNREVITHELSHLLHNVFFGNSDEKTRLQRIYEIAKDEIMAYLTKADLKEEINYEGVIALLSSNLDGSAKEIYDYFSFSDNADVRATYNKDVAQAVAAYRSLLNAHFSHEEIREMLEGQHLSRWPRLAKRFTYDSSVTLSLSTVWQYLFGQAATPTGLQVEETIGRRSSNSIQIAPFIQDVSRLHAQILRHEASGALFIRDMNSSFGTRLNGVMIPAMANIELRVGDVVRIGSEDNFVSFDVVFNDEVSESQLRLVSAAHNVVSDLDQSEEKLVVENLSQVQYLTFTDPADGNTVPTDPQHAEILTDDAGHLYIRHWGRFAATVVNGQQLHYGELYLLQEGDVVYLGEHKQLIVYDGAAGQLFAVERQGGRLQMGAARPVLAMHDDPVVAIPSYVDLLRAAGYPDNMPLVLRMVTASQVEEVSLTLSQLATRLLSDAEAIAQKKFTLEIFLVAANKSETEVRQLVGRTLVRADDTWIIIVPSLEVMSAHDFNTGVRGGVPMLGDARRLLNRYQVSSAVLRDRLPDPSLEIEFLLGIGSATDNEVQVRREAGINNYHLHVWHQTDGGGLYIKHIALIEGTYLNGVRVMDEELLRLEVGDELVLGSPKSKNALVLRVVQGVDGRLSLVSEQDNILVGADRLTNLTEISTSPSSPLATSAPDGCSDCFAVTKLVDSSLRRAEELHAAGQQVEALALLRNTNDYLNTHLFANQPLQEQLLAQVEQQEAILVRSQLEQEQAIRALTRWQSTLEGLVSDPSLDLQDMQTLQSVAAARLAELRDMEVTASPWWARWWSGVDFQLRSFAIDLAYSRSYQVPLLRQWAQAGLRHSLWFQPVAEFFDRQERAAEQDKRQLDDDIATLCQQLSSCQQAVTAGAVRSPALMFLELTRLSTQQPAEFTPDQLTQVATLIQRAKALDVDYAAEAAPLAVRAGTQVIRGPIEWLHNQQTVAQGGEDQARDYVLGLQIDQVVQAALPLLLDGDNRAILQRLTAADATLSTTEKMALLAQVLRRPFAERERMIEEEGYFKIRPIDASMHPMQLLLAVGDRKGRYKGLVRDHQVIASALNSVTSAWRLYASLNLNAISTEQDLNAVAFDETWVHVRPAVAVNDLTNKIDAAYGSALSDVWQTWSVSADKSLLNQLLADNGVTELFSVYNRTDDERGVLVPQRGHRLVTIDAQGQPQEGVITFDGKLYIDSSDFLSSQPSHTQQLLDSLPVLIIDLQRHETESDLAHATAQRANEWRHHYRGADFVTLVRTDGQHIAYSTNTDHKIWDGGQTQAFMEHFLLRVHQSVAAVAAAGEVQDAPTLGITPEVVPTHTAYQEFALNVDVTEFYARANQVAETARAMASTGALPAKSPLRSTAFVMQLALLNKYRQVIGAGPAEVTGVLLGNQAVDDDLDLIRFNAGFDLQGWLTASVEQRQAMLVVLQAQVEQAAAQSNIRRLIARIAATIPSRWHGALNRLSMLPFLRPALSFLQAPSMMSGFPLPAFDVNGYPVPSRATAPTDAPDAASITDPVLRAAHNIKHRQQVLGQRYAGPALTPTQLVAMTLDSVFVELSDDDGRLEQMILSIRFKHKDNAQAQLLAQEMEDYIGGGWKEGGNSVLLGQTTALDSIIADELDFLSKRADEIGLKPNVTILFDSASRGTARTIDVDPEDPSDIDAFMIIPDENMETLKSTGATGEMNRVRHIYGDKAIEHYIRILPSTTGKFFRTELFIFSESQFTQMMADEAEFASQHPDSIEFIKNVLQGRVVQGSLPNFIVDSSSPFSLSCSSCAEVRAATKAGVEAADLLYQEVQALVVQAETAATAGDNTQAQQLRAQAKQKEAAALQQLQDTRYRVVNTHGMQNQCVQLYLNAWVATREALIRRTAADLRRAIDLTYEATVLAETLLESKLMTVRSGGVFGWFGKSEQIALTEADLYDITNIIYGTWVCTSRHKINLLA